MQRTDGRAHDGGDGVVVFGVVDGADDGPLWVMGVAHEDVEGAWHRLQEICAREPDVAGLEGIQVFGVRPLQFVQDKVAERAVEHVLEASSARGVADVALEVAGQFGVPPGPPGWIGRSPHVQQFPEHGREGQAGRRGRMVVVGHHGREGRVGPDVRAAVAQVRDEHGRDAHEGPVAG